MQGKAREKKDPKQGAPTAVSARRRLRLAPRRLATAVKSTRTAGQKPPPADSVARELFARVKKFPRDAGNVDDLVMRKLTDATVPDSSIETDGGEAVAVMDNELFCDLVRALVVPPPGMTIDELMAGD